MSTRPESRSFAHSDRFTESKDGDAAVLVMVDGQQLPGTVLGYNGPRVQVRFVRDGSSYVRWFNSSDIGPEPPPAA